MIIALSMLRRFKRFLSVLLFLLWLSPVVQSQESQGDEYRFVLLTTWHSMYLFDGATAQNLSGDELVVTFTATENALLMITDDYVSGQNILRVDWDGQVLSSLTNFTAANTPIWVDIVDIPFSDDLIAEFETIGTLDSGLYRFDPGDMPASLSFIGQGSYSNPDISPDGRQLVFDRNVQRLTDLGTPFVYSAIVLYDLETTDWMYATSELQGSCSGAHWHPSQNRIVYICGIIEDTHILRTYVTDADSAETERLPYPEKDVYGCGPVWSPDGEAIAYNTNAGIAILTLNTATFEFLAYPSEISDQGVSCFEWVS